jgi:galactokinase/mevalonate kinase-like predicted kinase
MTLILTGGGGDIEIFADDFHGAIIAAHAAGFTVGSMFGMDFTGIIRS